MTLCSKIKHHSLVSMEHQDRLISRVMMVYLCNFLGARGATLSKMVLERFHNHSQCMYRQYHRIWTFTQWIWQTLHSHMSLQMQQMQPFPHPIVPPGLHLSEDDIVRIASKMKELLSDEIKTLVKTQIEAAVAPLRDELNSMKSDLAKVQKELKNAIVRNDDLGQYSRRSCLRIVSIKESDNQDVTQKVQELAQHVEAAISIHDIDRAHRVDSPRDDIPTDIPDSEEDISDEPRGPRRSREIIVKFTNTSARLRSLKGRAILRTRKENTNINEVLAKKRGDLAYESRKLKKANRIKKTWVYNGHVFLSRTMMTTNWASHQRTILTPSSHQNRGKKQGRQRDGDNFWRVPICKNLKKMHSFLNFDTFLYNLSQWPCLFRYYLLQHSL